MIFIINEKSFFVLSTFGIMKPTGNSNNQLAYKWLSWCLLLIFGYYWLITFGLVFFGTKVSAVIPNQTFVYRSFARQNWRMFAFTKVYNRQMLLVIKDRNNPGQTDTTDLVQSLLSEKRGYAPFNNEQDAHERIFYIVMNNLEVRIHHHEKKIKDTLPGKTPAFYQQQAIQQVIADTVHQQDINNIVGFARFILQKKNISTNSKEYQLILKHKYITPARPALPDVPGGDEQTLFKSDYKPF